MQTVELFSQIAARAQTVSTATRALATQNATAFASGAAIAIVSLVIFSIWKRSSNATLRVRAADGPTRNSRVLTGEILPPPAFDLTSAGGGKIPKGEIEKLYAAFGGKSSADITPEFNKNWTNEMIGYEFHSLWRHIERVTGQGKPK